MNDHEHQVRWFRAAAPYINAHRSRTLVLQFSGGALCADGFAELVNDFALLRSLGLKLVLVHGARPQIESSLRAHGMETPFHNGVRVTSDAALPAVMQAIGAVRVEIEAKLSMGLSSSRAGSSRIRVATGNFIVARPMGVRAGLDHHHAGEVRGIDTEAIRDNLDDGAVVLVSPLGYSPTGEVFNLLAEDVATAIAIELRADKLIFLRESGLPGNDGSPVAELELEQAKQVLRDMRRDAVAEQGAMVHLLGNAIHACRNGVNRTHLLDRHVPGAVLLELYSRDGIGTMVYADPYDATRQATIHDVGGILELIDPLEREGALVRRSREKLESEIGHFIVMERDGLVIACAAAYPCEDAGIVELACLAVHPDYRKNHHGDALLEQVEAQARGNGFERLFVLTTLAVHWFKERGFIEADIEALPVEKQRLYNYERRSKVLLKSLRTD